MTYIIPTDTDYVSCSHQCHQDRNPPSTEPGTDIACGYGSPVYAPAAGWVTDLKHDPGGATGRYVAVDMDDGRRARGLHMSEVWVSVGQYVSQGDQLGLSGASGYGDEWFYGPHLHQTLWDCHCYQFCSSCTLDFMLYVTPATPPPSAPSQGDEDMRTILYVTNGTIFTFAPQQVKAETDVKAAAVVRNVTGSTVNTPSGYHECGPVEISALCESYGVPWYAVERAQSGQAFGIDGSPGGYFWSWAFESAQRGAEAVEGAYWTLRGHERGSDDDG